MTKKFMYFYSDLTAYEHVHDSWKKSKTKSSFFPDREYLVLAWMTLLCVYVLQLIMGIWLLAATREVRKSYYLIYF